MKPMLYIVSWSAPCKFLHDYCPQNGKGW